MNIDRATINITSHIQGISEKRTVRIKVSPEMYPIVLLTLDPMVYALEKKKHNFQPYFQFTITIQLYHNGCIFFQLQNFKYRFLNH